MHTISTLNTYHTECVLCSTVIVDCRLCCASLCVGVWGRNVGEVSSGAEELCLQLCRLLPGHLFHASQGQVSCLRMHKHIHIQAPMQGGSGGSTEPPFCVDIELKKCFLTDTRQPNQNSTIILRFLDA